MQETVRDVEEQIASTAVRKRLCQDQVLLRLRNRELMTWGEIARVWPQVTGAETEPDFLDLIARYKWLTGIPR